MFPVLPLYSRARFLASHVVPFVEIIVERNKVRGGKSFSVFFQESINPEVERTEPWIKWLNLSSIYCSPNVLEGKKRRFRSRNCIRYSGGSSEVEATRRKEMGKEQSAWKPWCRGPAGGWPRSLLSEGVRELRPRQLCSPATGEDEAGPVLSCAYLLRPILQGARCRGSKEHRCRQRAAWPVVDADTFSSPRGSYERTKKVKYWSHHITSWKAFQGCKLSTRQSSKHLRLFLIQFLPPFTALRSSLALRPWQIRHITLLAPHPIHTPPRFHTSCVLLRERLSHPQS